MGYKLLWLALALLLAVVLSSYAYAAPNIEHAFCCPNLTSDAVTFNPPVFSTQKIYQKGDTYIIIAGADGKSKMKIENILSFNSYCINGARGAATVYIKAEDSANNIRANNLKPGGCGAENNLSVDLPKPGKYNIAVSYRDCEGINPVVCTSVCSGGCMKPEGECKISDDVERYGAEVVKTISTREGVVTDGFGITTKYLWEADKAYTIYLVKPEDVDAELLFNIANKSLEAGGDYGLITAKEGSRNEQFHVKLNTTVSECISRDFLVGKTGADAIPKVKLSWDWLREFSENSCSVANPDHIYCDSAQFTMSLMERLHKIVEFAKAGNLGSANSLLSFDAALVKDGYSNDFRDDFDAYFAGQFFNAPSYYNDLQEPSRLNKYLVANKARLEFVILNSAGLDTGSKALPEPGIYSVSITPAFDSGYSWKFFDASGNPTATIKVTMRKVSSPDANSPLYYLPFDAELGLSSGQLDRQGYGTGFSGEVIDVYKNSYTVSTKQSSDGSSPIANVSVTKTESFDTLNMTERGTVMNMSRTAIDYSPSVPSPVIAAVTGYQGTTAMLYNLQADYLASPSFVSGKNTVLSWTGVGSTMGCKAFDNSPLFFSKDDKMAGDINTSAVVCGLGSMQASENYGFSWKSSGAGEPKVFMRTVLYTPQGRNYLLAKFENQSCPAVGQDYIGAVQISPTSVESGGIMADIRSMQDILNLVKGKAVCVLDRSSGNQLLAAGGSLDFYWNEDYLQGRLEEKRQADLVNLGFNESTKCSAASAVSSRFLDSLSCNAGELPLGTCSDSKPKYCNFGSLEDNCWKCGCQDERYECANGSECRLEWCVDGAGEKYPLDTCSGIGQYCNIDGNIINNCGGADGMPGGTFDCCPPNYECKSSGQCEKLPSCTELGGVRCTPEQYCIGEKIYAYDTPWCCKGTCSIEPPPEDGGGGGGGGDDGGGGGGEPASTPVTITPTRPCAHQPRTILCLKTPNFTTGFAQDITINAPVVYRSIVRKSDNSIVKNTEHLGGATYTVNLQPGTYNVDFISTLTMGIPDSVSVTYYTR